jgi:hypothetical protein
LTARDRSPVQIAARFGVTSLIVQRRLKLANVALQFVELYRKGKSRSNI